VIFDKAYHKVKRFKRLDKKNVLFVVPLRKDIKIEDEFTIQLKAAEGNVVITYGELSNGPKVIVVKTPEIILISNAVGCNWYELVALYQLRSYIEVFL
jgi:hypothetical protein